MDLLLTYVRLQRCQVQVKLQHILKQFRPVLSQAISGHGCMHSVLGLYMLGSKLAVTAYMQYIPLHL